MNSLISGNMSQQQSQPKPTVWSSASSNSPIVASNFGGDTPNATGNNNNGLRGNRGTGVYSRGNWRGRGARGNSYTLPRFNRQPTGQNNNNQYLPNNNATIFAINNNNNVSRSSSFGMGGGGGGTGQWSSANYRGRYQYRGANNYRGRYHDGRNGGGGGMNRIVDSMIGDVGVNRPQQEPLLGIEPSPSSTSSYNILQDNRGNNGRQPYAGSQAVDTTINDIASQFGSLNLNPNEQAQSQVSTWDMQQQQQAMSGMMQYPFPYYQASNGPIYSQNSMGNYYAAPSNGTTYYLPIGAATGPGGMMPNPAMVNTFCDDSYCACRQSQWYLGNQYGGYPNYVLPWGATGYPSGGSAPTAPAVSIGGWKTSQSIQPSQIMPQIQQKLSIGDQHSVDSTVVAFSPPMSDDSNNVYDNIAATIGESGVGNTTGSGN